jgi:excisionase family DNA binding protein
MTTCVRIGIAASMLGVCTRTIRRWDAAGSITCTRTPGGHRRIALATIECHGFSTPSQGGEDACTGTAVYCRVSSHEQKAKGDLGRQVATATRNCAKAGLGRPAVFTDVRSGLNTTRPGLARLCKQVESGQVRRSSSRSRTGSPGSGSSTCGGISPATGLPSSLPGRPQRGRCRTSWSRT